MIGPNLSANQIVVIQVFVAYMCNSSCHCIYESLVLLLSANEIRGLAGGQGSLTYRIG